MAKTRDNLLAAATRVAAKAELAAQRETERVMAAVAEANDTKRPLPHQYWEAALQARIRAMAAAKILEAIKEAGDE